MNESLEHKIHRIRSVLAEAAYAIEPRNQEGDSRVFDLYREGNFQCSVLVDARTGFAEFFWPLEFAPSLQGVLAEVFMDFTGICYDHGIYFSLDQDDAGTRINLCVKLLFSALHYYALNETLMDLFACVKEVENLFSPAKHHYRGVQHGNKEPDGRQGDTGGQ